MSQIINLEGTHKEFNINFLKNQIFARQDATLYSVFKKNCFNNFEYIFFYKYQLFLMYENSY